MRRTQSATSTVWCTISCPHVHTTLFTHTRQPLYLPRPIAPLLLLLPFTSLYHTIIGTILFRLWGHQSSTYPFSSLHFSLPYSSFHSDLHVLSQVHESAPALPDQTALTIVCPGRSHFTPPPSLSPRPRGKTQTSSPTAM